MRWAILLIACAALTAGPECDNQGGPPSAPPAPPLNPLTGQVHYLRFANPCLSPITSQDAIPGPANGAWHQACSKLGYTVRFVCVNGYGAAMPWQDVPVRLTVRNVGTPTDCYGHRYGESGTVIDGACYDMVAAGGLVVQGVRQSPAVPTEFLGYTDSSGQIAVNVWYERPGPLHSAPFRRFMDVRILASLPGRAIALGAVRLRIDWDYQGLYADQTTLRVYEEQWGETWPPTVPPPPAPGGQSEPAPAGIRGSPAEPAAMAEPTGSESPDCDTWPLADDDQDFWPNARDECPGLPWGEAGCCGCSAGYNTTDTDGDGVVECPGLAEQPECADWAPGNPNCSTAGCPGGSPDMDGDGDADQDDYGILQACIGQVAPFTGLCGLADLYADGYIDRQDIAAFAACANGAAVAVTCRP